MKIFKPKFWQKKNSLVAFSLLPISFLFQFLIALKNKIIKKEKFSIPIICVGNIYLGGTGKTPLCIEIAEIFKKSGLNAAIIKKSHRAHQDEFNLIKSKGIKLFKDTSRASAIKEAEMQNFDLAILDDGLQDSSIKKNLNIVCFNSEQLAGNEMTMPSGPLRESLSSVKNCKMVVINGVINELFEKKIKSFSDSISVYYTKYSPTNLNQFTNLNLLAFAGIGNPNNFFKILEENNLKIKKKIYFPDHYNYSERELSELVQYSITNKLKIVTTEKDYFRIQQYQIQEIQCLKIKLEFQKKDNFERDLKKCLL